MLCRVLGPLEVWTGDGWTGVNAPKWRALLAVLLATPGQVVSTGRLVDELWGDDPPSGARKLVAGYVLRLRRLTGDPDGRVLVTQAPGYRVTVSRAGLDAYQFEDLLAAGRRALESKDASRAAWFLDEALALWRGPALADVPRGPAAAAEADRLDELHLGGIELRIEAAICCGRQAELVAELRALTAGHPLRERFWHQLMRALEGCGRTAEALGVYAQAREVIADELGSDPGPDLQQLHRRILAGRPADAPAPLSPPSGLTQAPAGRIAAVVPRQLPTAVAHFTGRTDELKILDCLRGTAGMGGTVVISAIGGTAGVGKTALAVHWAHQVAGEFPDGQLYVNLRGFDPSGQPATPAEAVRGFLDALQVPPDAIPADLVAQAGLYRSLVAGKRMLVVLDNARDAAQVRPLLPGSRDSLVVVTSRAQLTGLVAAEGAVPISLNVLSEADARQLLSRRMGIKQVAGEPEAVTELIGLCAGLPLALAVAAARAVARPDLPLAVLLAELREARDWLDALATGDTATDIRAVLSWSYQDLSEAAARMFRLLGLHPGPDISRAAAASLAAMPSAQVHAALRELTGAHLLIEHDPGRFAFHDLLRAYAAERAAAEEDDAGRRAAIHRILDHYLHTSYAAALLLNPVRDSVTPAAAQPGTEPEHLADREQAAAWTEAEHHVLLAAISLAAGTGFDTHAWQVPWTLTPYFNSRGHWSDWVRTQHQALAAVQHLGDVAGQADAHIGIANASTELHSFDVALAHLRDALALYGQLGDRVGQGRAHHGLSRLFGRQDHYGAALPEAQQALELYRAAGHRSMLPSALNAVGWCHAHLGNYQQAIISCEQAIGMSRELGDRFVEGAALDTLGYIYHHLRRYPEAINCYENSFGLQRERGDHYNQAVVIRHLGDTHYAAGDLIAARGAWQQALNVLNDLRHPEAGQVRAQLSRDPG